MVQGSAGEAGAAQAWQRLRAVRILVDRRWVEYVGVYRWHRHVVQLPEKAGRRVLDRDDLFWWALGFADGHQAGDEILAVRDEPVPPMVSLEEIQEQYGENYHTAKKMWADEKFYRLWLRRRHRYVFEAQYVALLGSWALLKGFLPAGHEAQVSALIEEWVAILNQLPTPQLPDLDKTMAGWVPPPPAIPVHESDYLRRLQALTVGGEQEGWFHFDAHVDRSYKLDVPISLGKVVGRVLPEEAVLPYVQGIGDSHGHGCLVTYQEPDR